MRPSVAAVDWVEDEWSAAPCESSQPASTAAPAASPLTLTAPPKRLNSLASTFLPAAIFARPSPPAVSRLLADGAAAAGGDGDGEECEGEGGPYAAWEDDGEGGDDEGNDGRAEAGGAGEGGVGSALLAWGRNLFHRPPPASLSPPSTLLQPLTSLEARAPSSFRPHAATIGSSAGSSADGARSLAGKLWGALAPRSTHAHLLSDVSSGSANISSAPLHSSGGATRGAPRNGARGSGMAAESFESARSAREHAAGAPGGTRGRGNWSAGGGTLSAVGAQGSREGLGGMACGGEGGGDGGRAGAVGRGGDGHGAQGGGGQGWAHKVLEVLPVLAVVTLMVFGTVAYLTVVDAILPRLRPAFSLACPLQQGHWALSSRRPLYPPSCPFLRDDFNCAKFGLSARDTWRWEPSQCQVAEFSAGAWLRGMAGRRVAYVGDRAVANAFDSLLCMLAQADSPTPLSPASPHRGLSATSDPSLPVTGERRGIGGSGGRQGESVRAAADGRVFIGALDAPGAAPDLPHATSGAPHAASDAPPAALHADLAATPRAALHARARGRGGAGSEVRRGGARHSDGGWGWNSIRWGAWSRQGSRQRVGAADDASSSVDATGDSGTTSHGGSSPAAAASVSSGLFDMQPLHYWFPRFNFTLALLPSPFLVRTSLHAPVNATLCQLQRAAAATPLNGSTLNSTTGSSTSSSSSTTSSGAPASEAAEHAAAAPPADSSSGKEEGAAGGDVCYPNRMYVDEPDPAWAEQAAQFDVLVLASGRSWTEEAVETNGLSIVAGGVRRSELSVEGLVGQWAYPLAMQAVASWLGNASHFNGTAVFRSFSPTHPRKECAARTFLPDAEHAADVMEEARRYDDAVAHAIAKAQDTSHTTPTTTTTAAAGAAPGAWAAAGHVGARLHWMNVSLLTAQRADAHPWMASPGRPTADCTSWCLPGVPDTWNELLAATLLKLFERH
ncbi:unnamed protein product [Closterium sp. NIES-65]|nr:unnamed protein product [Closterium sp. NIES-65]